MAKSLRAMLGLAVFMVALAGVLVRFHQFTPLHKAAAQAPAAAPQSAVTGRVMSQQEWEYYNSPEAARQQVAEAQSAGGCGGCPFCGAAAACTQES